MSRRQGANSVYGDRDRDWICLFCTTSSRPGPFSPRRGLSSTESTFRPRSRDSSTSYNWGMARLFRELQKLGDKIQLLESSPVHPPYGPGSLHLGEDHPQQHLRPTQGVLQASMLNIWEIHFLILINFYSVRLAGPELPSPPRTGASLTSRQRWRPSRLNWRRRTLLSANTWPWSASTATWSGRISAGEYNNRVSVSNIQNYRAFLQQGPSGLRGRRDWSTLGWGREESLRDDPWQEQGSSSSSCQSQGMELGK